MDQGIRARRNMRGMMSAHRITSPEGHRIGRRFTRIPGQYDQWEVFESDEDPNENEDEEQNRCRQLSSSSRPLVSFLIYFHP